MHLQNNAGKNNHKRLLIDLIGKCDSAILCSGWLKLAGVQALLPAIDAALERGARIELYSNRAQTPDDVLAALATRQALAHRIVDDTRRHLHTKLYYFQTADLYTAVIGSANITIGGLRDNEELSIVHSGTVGDATFVQVRQYLQDLAALKFVTAARR